MRVILTLIEGLTSEEGQIKVAEIGPAPFRIGRAPEADWTLTDPQSVTSRFHFELREWQGALLVTDTSSGGTALDRAEAKLRRDQPAPLPDRARLILPAGAVQVEVDRSGAGAPARASASDGGLPGGLGAGRGGSAPPRPAPGTDAAAEADDVFGTRSLRARRGGGGEAPQADPSADPFAGGAAPPPPPERTSEPRRTPAPSLGGGAGRGAPAGLGRGDLAPRAPGGDPFGGAPEGPAPAWPAAEDDPFGPAPAAPSGAAPQPPGPAAPQPPGPAAPPPPAPGMDPPASPPAALPSGLGGAPAAPAAPAAPPDPGAFGDRREASPPSPERSPASPAPDPAPPAAAPGAEAALRAFYEAAGLSLDDIPPERRLEAAAEAGRTFQRMADALRRLLESRAEAKRELGVAGTQIEFGANPLKVSPTPVAAVQGLLRPFGQGYLSGEAAVDDALGSMQQHQAAMITAIRAAIRIALASFDPDELERKLQARGLASISGMARRAALWEAFREDYGRFAAQADDDIRMVFGRELDRLYRTPGGRGGSGPEDER